MLGTETVSAARKPLTWEVDAADDDGAATGEGGTSAVDVVEELHVTLRRGHEHTVPEQGVRYQRCGGGRRIIRRHGGAT